jgi:hypothetical protein
LVVRRLRITHDMDTIHDIEVKHQDIGHEARYEFSDRVVTLAAGLLGISVSMRGWVVGHSSDHLCILKFAWVCLALSSIAGIIWRYSKIQINLGVAKAIKPAVKAGGVSLEVVPSPFHRFCFKTSIYSLIVGIIAFTAYALSIN